MNVTFLQEKNQAWDRCHVSLTLFYEAIPKFILSLRSSKISMDCPSSVKQSKKVKQWNVQSKSGAGVRFCACVYL